MFYSNSGFAKNIYMYTYIKNCSYLYTDLALIASFLSNARKLFLQLCVYKCVLCQILCCLFAPFGEWHDEISFQGLLRETESRRLLWSCGKTPTFSRFREIRTLFPPLWVRNLDEQNRVFKVCCIWCICCFEDCLSTLSLSVLGFFCGAGNYSFVVVVV